MKSNLPMGFFHEPMTQQAHLSNWVPSIKKSLLIGCFLVFLSFTSGTYAQIDYGTIKLYNSLTDLEILDISNGATYDLNVVGDSLNIIVEPPVPSAVGSVTFTTSIAESGSESVAPYAYKGDISGDFRSWLSLPNHLDTPIVFTIEYWDAGSGTGNKLGDDVFTITFTKPFSDTQVPSAPTLSSTGHTEVTTNLSWSGATDNVGVTGYKVFKDGALVVTLGNVTAYQVTGLTASTTYDFTVTALDAASNESSSSNTVSVTTSTSSGGGGSVWTESGSTASYIGNVAIGTNSVPSGYALAINGHVRAREIRVDQDTWPDYVFRKGYALSPLQEVEEFIEEHGHLPNIPSAERVATEGLQLGEMDRLLLEKIEELTLYILEQQRQIDQLQSKMEGLR